MVFEFELLGARLRLFHFAPPFSAEMAGSHLQALTGARAPVEYSHLPSGRPYIPDWTGDLSLAHTRGACIAGVVPGPWRIGVDLEEEDQSLARPLEETLIALSNGGDPLTAWTLSEALFKCLDKSFSLAQLTLKGDGRGRYEISSPYSKDMEIVTKGWTWLQADLRISVVLGAPASVWSAALSEITWLSSDPPAAEEAWTPSRPSEIVPVRTIY